MMQFRGSRYCLALGAAVLAASCGDGSSSSTNGPAIGSVAAVSINQDTTAVVPLKVSDNQAAASTLTVAATAADGNLVVPQGISVQNSGAGLNLLVTPLEETTGSTTINVMVTDPKGNTAQTSFTLTVNAVNVDFSAIAEQAAAAAETAEPLSVNGFTVVQDSDSTLPAPLATILSSATTTTTTTTASN